MREYSICVLFILAVIQISAEDCRDHDFNCRDWVAASADTCDSTDYIKRSCKKSCGLCGMVDKRFDLRRLPAQLQPIAFLVGKWRSEHGGKAVFPTIPKFTYGEEVIISIPDDEMQAQKALNYTAHAWAIEGKKPAKKVKEPKNSKTNKTSSDPTTTTAKPGSTNGTKSAFAWSIGERDELHSEYGYISINPRTKEVALTTVMNNGFVTVEEGPMRGNQIKFRLRDIGRISFSRDLPVHDLVREWTLLNANLLQARLNMETLTHGMQEHTFVRYDKMV